MKAPKVSLTITIHKVSLPRQPLPRQFVEGGPRDNLLEKAVPPHPKSISLKSYWVQLATPQAALNGLTGPRELPPLCKVSHYANNLLKGAVI